MFFDAPAAPGDDELRLVIYIDRGLDIKSELNVKRGTTIGQVKHILASADPTGKADTSSFALRLPYSFGKALGDIELVPDGCELELCQPGDDVLDEPSPAPEPERPGTEWEMTAGAGFEGSPDDEKDLAMRCHAQASSSKSAERQASHAVDGDPTTRWSSAYEDEQWLMVDLGSLKPLLRVDIRWEHACAAHYLVQGSVDTVAWYDLALETGHEGWVSSNMQPGSWARFVRMFGLKRATDFGFSIWEFRVIEGAWPPETAEAAKGTVEVAKPAAAEVQPYEDDPTKMPAGLREAEQAERIQQLAWRPPPKAGFRLGEYLWTGASRLEQAPKCEFFPRTNYAALTLPPARKGFGPTLLLFGGMAASKCQNDVWRLSLPRLGAQRAFDANGKPNKPRWTPVSPQDDGKIEQGRRIMKKWRGRQNFGYSSALANGGGLLIYVAGGNDGNSNNLNDVWASEDGAATWRCMCREAGWQKRHSPGLLAVPGRPVNVVLAGGMGNAAHVCQDVWTSDDAGATWTELEQPVWSQICGRYKTSLLPLVRRPEDDEGTVRLLLFGGCFIDGGEGGYGGFERLMHDAWECILDLTAVDQRRAASWLAWGTATEARGRDWAKIGVEDATVAIDQNSNTIIARLPEKDFLCVVEGCAPSAGLESVEWHQARTDVLHEALEASLRDGAPDSASQKLNYIRFASAGRGSIPRLLVVTPTEALVSGDGEWRRQVTWTLLLGLRLHRMYGIPDDLWMGRVLPALLPSCVFPKKRVQAATTPGVGGYIGTLSEGQKVGRK